MAGNPRLYSLPDDDLLRTVVWTGRVNAQSAEFRTARFTVWLRRVDETGSFIDDLVDEVVESVGAISLFPLGACFRRQRRVPRVDNTPATILSIRVPERWTVRRAIDRQPGTNESLISARDLVLKLKSRRGEEIPAFAAYLVVAETKNGMRVLIPCSEVYRAFYSGSSELANSHFRRPWSSARHDFIENANESFDSKGRRLWHLDLVENVPPSVALDLCWLEFVPGAAQIASQTHVSVVNQMQRRGDTWIRAAPPISAGILLIRAQTMHLPRSSAVLVTQIRDFKPDFRVAKITCTIAERVVPSAPGSEPPKAPIEHSRRKPSAIAKAGDKRNTNGFFELDNDPINWLGLPDPEVSPRQIRGDGGGAPTRSEGVEAPVQVSVGEPSDKDGARPAAQLTSTEALRLEQRFRDVIEALNRLRDTGGITSWDYHPIYNPVQERYCSFPELASTPDNLKAARWCRIENRTRYALVLKLVLNDRTMYWIEIEPVPRGYKGLAVETVDGQPIDELNVHNLLESCAFSKGVWDESFEASRPLLLAAERHDQLKQGRRLSPNMFLRAFLRLASKRERRATAETQIAHKTEVTLSEDISADLTIPY